MVEGAGTAYTHTAAPSWQPAPATGTGAATAAPSPKRTAPSTAPSSDVVANRSGGICSREQERRDEQRRQDEQRRRDKDELRSEGGDVRVCASPIASPMIPTSPKSP